MIIFFIFMFLSYAATIYFMVHQIFFFALLCFISNSCLTLLCILKLLRRGPGSLPAAVPHTAVSHIEKPVDKPAYILQASGTIARLQLANQKLAEENKRLERLIKESK